MFVIISCTHEDFEGINQVENQSAREWFNSEITSSSPNFFSEKKIKWDWNNLEQLPNNSLMVSSISSTDKYSYYKLEIIAIEQNYEAVIYMYNPTQATEGTDFEGRELAIDLSGEILYTKYHESSSTNNNAPKKNLLSTTARNSEDGGCISSWCWDYDIGAWGLREVVVTFTKPKYNKPSAHSGIDWAGVKNYINSRPNTSNYYKVPDNIASGSSSGSGGSDDIIIDKDYDSGYPCQAYITREATGVCAPLTNLILQIFEQDNDINLVFKNGSTKGSNASTTNIVGYNTRTGECNITITLSDDYLEKATDLSIARTVIHESFHASLVFMVAEGKFSGNPDAPFKDLMDGYVNYLSTNDNTKYAGAQHEIMADLNRDIASALSKFGRKTGYSLPFSYYETVAWGGLVGSVQFNKLFPKNLANGNINPQWLTINNILASEQNNQTNLQDGNGNKITPKGKPCQ